MRFKIIFAIRMGGNCQVCPSYQNLYVCQILPATVNTAGKLKLVGYSRRHITRLNRLHAAIHHVIDATTNKFAQSNLGRGPRRGTVAHVRRKVLIEYNGAPHIRPQNYPFPWTDRQTPPPVSSLDLSVSDLWCQTASRSDPPFFHNALHRPTDRQIVHGKVWRL